MTSQELWRGYAFVLVILLLAVSAQAQQLQPVPYVYRDAQGRISGTAERNGAVTTFCDGLGRITGTAERMPDGLERVQGCAGAVDRLGPISRGSRFLSQGDERWPTSMKRRALSNAH